MEEIYEVTLISTTDLKKIGNVIQVLEDNNIPYVYNSGFSSRQNSSFVNKKIIVSSQDYLKAKKLIEEMEKFFSEDAKIVDPPDELKNIDEEYFEKQEEKLKKHEENDKIISKIIVYIIFIMIAVPFILHFFGII